MISRKTTPGLLCVLVFVSAAAAQSVQVSSPRIAITYNSHLQRSIQWKGQSSGNIIAFDPAVQEGLVTAGLEINDFQLDPARSSQKHVVDPEFGPALEATIVGTSAASVARVGGGDAGVFRVERTIRVLLPEKYPDAAIFQNTYKNLENRPLHLDRIYSQRVLLDRKLAEPAQPSYALATFQGGAYRWGTDYAVMWLKPGFQQSNFQGVDDVNGPEGSGGGTPFVDAWSPTMGVAIMHLAKSPQWLSLPVEVRKDDRVELAITENPLEKLGQHEWLKPGESYQTVLTSMVFHRLDYFDPLKIYGQLLRARGVAIPEKSPDSAYEPYWKSWGWGRDFTVDKFMAILPQLKSMGIKIANLDDGWYDYMGDWEINRSAGKFPKGEPDMVDFVKKVHGEGFKSVLWWYPLGVDPKSKLAREHKDLLVQDENGNYPLDVSGLHQLCPGNEASLAHIRGILKRVLADYGFDGVYTDFQGLSAVPACFNKAHHHKTPLDSFQSMPKLFETINTTLHQYKPDADHEVCICSLPHSPYNMPFYDIANASDPVSTWMVRSRVKAEKAIRGGTFAVGDCYQIPMQEWDGYSVPESFETAMGTGAQMTTFYGSLDERQLELWKRWFHDYRTMGLGSAQYVNLYDLAFDKPEVHVVRKGKDLYYGIFADVWPRNKRIELRGLDKNATYEIYDYANRRALGDVKGATPFLEIGFKDSLLVRVRQR